MTLPRRERESPDLNDPLPASIESEKLLFGAVLRNQLSAPSDDGSPLVFETMRTELRADEFHLRVHQIAWGVLDDLWARGFHTFDYATLAAELENRGHREQPPSYWLDLTAIPDLVNLPFHVIRVKRAAQQRRIMFKAQEAITRGFLDDEPAEIIASQHEFYGREIDSERPARAHEFTALAEDRYILSIPAPGIVFEIDRLRRERHELIGELVVKCSLPGARTYNGTLSVADFNLSSIRIRSERAKLLREQARTSDLDWLALLEEFCQRVIEAERRGQPAKDLRDFPDVNPQDRMIRVDDLDLLRDHPTIWFGDGGTAKSYLALRIAGKIAQQGVRVALFDWELKGEDHKSRLKSLFGQNMPRIAYARCESALVNEADRLRRIVSDENIAYAIFDSIAVACDGKPEDAEVATRYFRTVRSIGIGSLHITHVSKAENSDKYPFGSIFWHNLARSTWYVKKVESIGTPNNEIKICLYNRKANLTGLEARPRAFRINFDPGSTSFHTDNPADTPEFAEGMSFKQRMYELLRKGPLTFAAISEHLDMPLDTVKKYAREKSKFVVLDGGKVALKTAG